MEKWWWIGNKMPINHFVVIPRPARARHGRYLRGRVVWAFYGVEARGSPRCRRCKVDRVGTDVWTIHSLSSQAGFRPPWLLLYNFRILTGKQFFLNKIACSNGEFKYTAAASVSKCYFEIAYYFKPIGFWEQMANENWLLTWRMNINENWKGNNNNLWYTLKQSLLCFLERCIYLIFFHWMKMDYNLEKRQNRGKTVSMCQRTRFTSWEPRVEVGCAVHGHPPPQASSGSNLRGRDSRRGLQELESPDSPPGRLNCPVQCRHRD